MNKEIDELNEKVKKYCQSIYRYDEEMFNLGVELGRLLEKNNIASYRPDVFVDFENKNNAYEILRKEFKRIEDVIEFLVHLSIKKHIEKHGDFEFSKGFTCNKIDSEIVDSLCVQLVRVTQQEYGGSFEAEFELSGDVLELLQQCGIGNGLRSDIDNTTGDEHETIYDTADIKHIVFGISLRINRRNEGWDLEKLREVAEKLEQKQAWLSLQGI